MGYHVRRCIELKKVKGVYQKVTSGLFNEYTWAKKPFIKSSAGLTDKFGVLVGLHQESVLFHMIVDVNGRGYWACGTLEYDFCE